MTNDIFFGTIDTDTVASIFQGATMAKIKKYKDGRYHTQIYLKTVDFGMATEFVSQKIPGGIHTKNSFRKAWDSYFLAICGHLPTSCPFIFEKVGSKYEQIVNKTDKITPHMLRHTFCTMMHENGVDIKTAQQQMGHSDTKTTMNVYTHVTSQFEAKEMQKMDFLA